MFAEHVKAVQARDLPALERTITLGEQLTLILPNGTQTSTRQAYVDFHKEFFATKTWTIQFEPVSRIVGADFAVLTTKSLYQDVVDGKPYRSRSWVTFTFQKEAGTVAAGPRPEHAAAARAAVVSYVSSHFVLRSSPRPTARISSTVSRPMHGIAPRARTSPRSSFRASAIAGKHGTCGP